MTTADDSKDDVKDAEAPEAKLADSPSPEEVADAGSRALATAPPDASLPAAPAADASVEEEDDDDFAAPAQLGAQRFVFAAYFTGAVAVAFLLSKALSFGWSRLALWKPQLGEPDEMVCVVSSAVIGALVAFFYYRDERTRTLAEEVASELGKVTWPTRDEVVNGTFVVVVTTFVATAFFALMDRFWGFVTNLVYGA